MASLTTLSYTVLVRPLAEGDMDRARSWYSAEAPHIVSRFETELDAALQRAAAAPFAFREIVRDARRAHLRVFPYEVWFRVHEEPRIVEVLAVVHDRQDHTRFTDRVG